MNTTTDRCDRCQTCNCDAAQPDDVGTPHRWEWAFAEDADAFLRPRDHFQALVCHAPDMTSQERLEEARDFYRAHGVGELVAALRQAERMPEGLPPVLGELLAELAEVEAA